MSELELELSTEIAAIRGCLDLLTPLIPSARARAVLYIESKIADMNKTREERLREAKAKRFALEKELADCNCLIGGLSDEVA